MPRKIITKKIITKTLQTTLHTSTANNKYGSGGLQKRVYHSKRQKMRLYSGRHLIRLIMTMNNLR